MKKIIAIIMLSVSIRAGAQKELPLLKISPDKRFFQTSDGKPFFWLGDTGWLLFLKTTREEAVHYLETRKQQGYNVVQAMILHELKSDKNVYDDSALINLDVSKLRTTPGSDFRKADEYDYWDHIDFIVDEAGKRGIYMAMVPVWGGNVKKGFVNVNKAEAYAAFLAARYKNKNNIIWLNGGDIKGSDSTAVWKAMGVALKKNDARHLVTFHPFGRNTSSSWFHKENWLDFNMFQSGHKTYAQDTSSKDKLHYGEDNWRYVQNDYSRKPVKPTLDGEPSYENIPHGLHDSTLPRWKDADLRRYACWSIFAGAAGFTYGENSIMQFHTPGDEDANFGANKNWRETINAPGAKQMHYIKDLILSKFTFDRVPAQEIITDNTQDKYNYILATKGKNCAMAYTYTGRPFKVDISKLGFPVGKAGWFNPSDGTIIAINDFRKKGEAEFDPPGAQADGNDWVLVLDR